eukprot:SAG31_NODE_136_length_23089_cov_8.825924_24_plen_58_part_00
MLRPRNGQMQKDADNLKDNGTEAEQLETVEARSAVDQATQRSTTVGGENSFVISPER